MSLRNRLKRQLRNRQFRHAYADEHLNLSISTQIKTIREQQKMSQSSLAEKIRTKQAGISRIESANYDRWSIALLRRVAEALDLRLHVSFEEFGTLWKEVGTFSRESLERRTFDDDPEFKEATAMAQAAGGTRHSNVIAIDVPWRIVSASSPQSDIRQGVKKMPPSAAVAGSAQEMRA